LTVKDKAQHAVLLDKATSEKLYKDVQSYRLVTVATLVDRMKINGSLARKCLKDLEEKGQIKQVVGHSKMKIYSTFRWRCQNNRKTLAILTALSARAVGGGD
jgi:small subunit ribosomal protein S25e